MTTNEYYAGMPRMLFPSKDLMKETLRVDGWHRATRDVWFRVVDRDIQFLRCGLFGPRGSVYAVFHAQKELEPSL